MPAAAVTPAPIAYIKVAAVKKLVVGSRYHCCLSVFEQYSRLPVHGSKSSVLQAVGCFKLAVVAVSPFSHVCGAIPTGVGVCQAVHGFCRVRRLACMPLDALHRVCMGGWHVYFEQI